MNRNEFLQNLRNELSPLPQLEIEDIIRDQTEFIDDAMASGKTEQQATAMLGSPHDFARNIKAQIKVDRATEQTQLTKKVGGTVDALMAIAFLTPFNFIFVLGPFCAAAGLTLAGWIVSGALVIASVAMLFAFLFKFLFVTASIAMQLSALSFIVASVAATGLMLIAMYWITYIFMKLTIAYIKWNLNFVKARVA